MALTEETVQDKIEIVGEFKHVQVRTATVIKKDGTEVSRKFERYMLMTGTLDESDNFVVHPLDKEPDGVTAIPDKVKAICNAVWTTSVKDAYKAYLIANKSS